MRPEVSAAAEELYAALDPAFTIGEEEGEYVPPHTNLLTRPNSELASMLFFSGSYLTSRVRASDEGIEPIIPGHEYLTKSVYAGGVDSNAGFFAYNFPAAGTYTVSIYCQLGANWDGGDVQFNAEGYAGSAEVDVLKAEAIGKGTWQRVVCRITVVAGDLVGNMVLRAVPGFPTAGRAMYFDAGEIDAGEEALEYVDGDSFNSRWLGTPGASSSEFLGIDRSWPVLRLCAALTTGNIDLIQVIVSDTALRPGWQILFDPYRCPAIALPYLAQFCGAKLTVTMDEAEQRAEIAEPATLERGTPAAILATTKKRLTGTKFALLTERYLGFAYRMKIVTLEAETPEPALTLAEIKREQKPMGIRLFFNSAPGMTWKELAEEKPTWKKVIEGFATWADVLAGP